MAKTTINPNHIMQLKNQRRSIGLLQFKLKDDVNFSKWYSLTENLVIKAFGQKSNQFNQLKVVYGNMHRKDDWISEKRLDTKEVKEKFKNLITGFITELELDVIDKPKTTKRSGISIKMTNTQTVNQNVNVTTVVRNIIQNIQQSEPDSDKANEAEQKLLNLEKELKSQTPKWANIKSILEWLLNFSRDAFLSVLPIIIEKYN